MMTIYNILGGRKVTGGLVAAIMLTIMAPILGAGYVEYAGALLVALGITSGTVAYEDARRE